MYTGPVPEFYRNISDFNILNILGSGSYGEILEAYDTRYNHKVALKKLNKKFIYRKSNEEKIQREILLLSLIDDEKIVKCYGLSDDDNNFYIIMELIEGITLTNFIRLYDEEYPPEHDVKKIFYNILEAVNILHRYKIIHRDLKPDNIMITEKFKIKLCDFGTSKFIKDDTLTKTYCGTPCYMSPESFVEKGISYERDYWSICIIILELCLCSNPFVICETFHEIIDKTNNMEKYIDDIFPDFYSKDLKDILIKGTIQDKEKRFKSYDDFMNHEVFKDYENKDFNISIDVKDITDLIEKNKVEFRDHNDMSPNDSISKRSKIFVEKIKKLHHDRDIDLDKKEEKN